MKNLLLIVLISIFSLTLSAQEKSTRDSVDHITLIKSFINELSDHNRSVDIVLSQYMIVEEPTDEIYDYLEVSLEEIRVNLMAKNLSDIQYIPYHKMARKDIRDIDTENLDKNNIYFLYYKNRQMLAVYIENDKIGSFTLVSKGNGKAHFVLY